MSNKIIVVLWHEPKFSPGSALRCYGCMGDGCKDPYTGTSAHEGECRSTLPGYSPYCVKFDIDNGKWLHKRHFNIYIYIYIYIYMTVTQNFSKYMTKFCNY